MATAKTAKPPSFHSFSRMIAVPGRQPETVFDLPSSALRVGDPLTDNGGRVELGVTSASMFLLDVGFGEDNVAIVVRARPSLAVRWELGEVGGVDSGVFGVWDAGARTTPSSTKEQDHVGACTIDGRQVYALDTGDGCFPCVVGFDEKDEVCAVVAGPGVDPARFGASLREEQLTEAERAERAARAVREARLAAADLLGETLGEERVSPALRWFVAGWLESLPEAERARAREELTPVLGGLALPKPAKKAKERAREDTAALLAWALSSWATVLAASMPEEAAMLAVNGSIDRKKMDWAKVLPRVFDHRMTARRFDVTRPYQPRSHEASAAASRAGDEQEAAMSVALRDVPPDLASRFGLSALETMSEKTAPHDELKNALWYASRGLAPSLELHVLGVRTADLPGADEEGAPALRPRDPGYVGALLSRLETPLALLLRLAQRA